MEFIDETELFEKYKNQWVALTDDHELICGGATLEEVLEKAKNAGYEEPVTAKIPDLRFEFIL